MPLHVEATASVRMNIHWPINYASPSAVSLPATAGRARLAAAIQVTAWLTADDCVTPVGSLIAGVFGDVPFYRHSKY